MRIAILGAGAAGCFCAIQIKRKLPEAIVEVFESGTKPLAKVAITGGGRCNLTNTFRDVAHLRAAYPRGEQLMKRALRCFSQEDTMRWFEQEGVRLVTQDDGCVFPASQDAMQIVNTLLVRMRQTGVILHTSHRVSSIQPASEGYDVAFQDERLAARHFDSVVCAIGGCPTSRMLSAFRHLPGISIAAPVPSLFTFCIDNTHLTQLMGCVVDAVSVSLAGTKMHAEGPLLITHWGMSGPAILRLSSYAARHLAEQGYRATLCVNWLNANSEQEAFEALGELQKTAGKRQLQSLYPRQFTANLWQFLLSRAGVACTKRWAELSRKEACRLCATLTSDLYRIEGKWKHKEEFVTCGGISLESVNISTLEAKHHPRLYFAGELLDVDGITGGFNLQAAWSMAWVVSENFRTRM